MLVRRRDFWYEATVQDEPPTGNQGPPATDAWYRALFEQSPTAMAILDAHLGFQQVNPAMGVMLGRTPAALLSMRATEVTHPDDLGDCLARFDEMRRGTPVNLEKRYLRPDGAVVWGHVTGSRWTGPDGADWALVVVQDITRNKHTEAMLADRDDELSTLFHEAPFPMAVNAPGGRFLRVNRALCGLVGYTPTELLAMDWLDLVDPLERVASRENDDRERRGEVSERDVVRRILTKGGQAAYLRCKAHVVRDRSGQPRYWLGQFVDLTPERRHEEERRTFFERLRQSQRTEAVGRVAGGVVHDFNNMLAVILNVAELARLRTPDARTREYAEQIHSAATRAAALSRRLMTFGRRDEGDPELLDLNVVVTELRHLLQRVTGEDIAFTTELAAPLDAVHMPRAQLEQVLLNLAVNARDAMPLGGRLVLRTSRRHLDEPDMELPAGDYVALEVEDSGTGITDDVVPQVFVPFFTTKEEGRGTGLGLAIVEHVITTAGGGVRLRTTLGVGTTFLLLLPAARATPPVPAPDPGSGVRRGRGERILVVEDELTLLDLTTQLLAEHGYVPLAAPGAQPALELVRHMRQSVDLLLTDIVMPGASGTELANRVRETHPNTRVLLMSGHPDDRIAGHGPKDRGHHLLRKPFSSLQLLAAVRRALDATSEP